MTGRIRRIVASFLIVCMASLSIPLPAVAGIVSTEQSLARTDRDRVAALLETCASSHDSITRNFPIFIAGVAAILNRIKIRV